MIELTTGVVFLVSALYGQATTDNSIQKISGSTPSIQVELQDNRSSTTTQVHIDNVSSAESYVRKVFVDEPILVDIARCESNFHQFDQYGDVIRGKANNADIGVMQINENYHAEIAKKLGFNLYTIEGNVAYAKHLYDEQGSKPWSASSKCWSKNDLAVK